MESLFQPVSALATDRGRPVRCILQAVAIKGCQLPDLAAVLKTRDSGLGIA